MKVVIQKVDVLTLAKISALFYACLGILAGVIFLIMSFFDGRFIEDASGSVVAIVGFLIFFPLLYTIVGFVTGAALTHLFNKAVNVLGGLTIEVDPCEEKKENRKAGAHASTIR
jgi:hypothetical protein